MSLFDRIRDLKEKAAKATPWRWRFSLDTPSVGFLHANKIVIAEKIYIADGEYLVAADPQTVAELCTALEEARELAESCDKVFQIVERVGRETFCHADFAPEHEKARAFLEKWGNNK